MMFEYAMTLRGYSPVRKYTAKAAVCMGLAGLAVLMPILVHAALGPQGGAQWLPMYLPVLLGGCLLGTKWGIAAAVLSPLASFLITSLAGNPMPIAERLPFMMTELAVFAAVSGFFAKPILKHSAWGIAAVILAQLSGRFCFFCTAVLSGSFTVSAAWTQLQSGTPGLLAQILLVPALLSVLRAILLREDLHD